MAIHMESPVGARTIFSGREGDYFSGTTYLGLQSHPDVIQAAMDCLQHYGLATGTSRGGYGESPVYDWLENEINAFFDTEKVLYFASGYLGNTIIAQGLRESYDHIFIDEWSHFSIWDGARSTGKPIITFNHLSAEHLKECLRRELKPGQRPLIMSDGLFPISGELAPVLDYLPLIEEFDGWLALDDAHASGVMGENGRGTLDYYQVQHPRCIASHTLSKALGGYGGVIAGSTELIDMLDRNSKVYVAASPPPLVAAAAAAKAMEIARTHPEMRVKLRENIAHARQGIRELGWDLNELPIPITCLRARSGIDLGELKNGLFERNIYTAHVTRYSSTPPGGALRIALFATHTKEQIDRLIT
ncbi:MAG: aminotransferase class I/II-fold pyridoxal phosphate-dependent enzyme, partial [Anaerolineaceae bacterium]|nr:aminotransferase class I/II-fold pyridoxal phosphate-dependent enzyme [Anaerolineaceae bacterium]